MAIRLVTSVVVAALLGSAGLALEPPAGCDSGSLRQRACSSGALTDNGAVVEGSIHGDDNVIDVDASDDGPENTEEVFCARRALGVCQFEFTVSPPAGALTLADIAAFAAHAGTLTTEPNGWAPIGLPLNAISTATKHEVEGMLLGSPATVRFTPVQWRWDFGDGAQPTTTTTAGATWAALRLPEFEPTTTSHVYRSRGRFPLAVTVTFVADYRIGGGSWAHIPGTLDLRVRAPAGIRVVSARTALVADNCTQNPRGPGC